MLKLKDISKYSTPQLRSLDAEVSNEIRSRYFFEMNKAREQIFHIAKSAGISKDELLSIEKRKFSRKRNFNRKSRAPDSTLLSSTINESTISEIINSKTVAELKKIGSEAEICAILNRIYYPFELSANTYQKILAALHAIHSSLTKLKHYPFVNRQAELAFCLTELDGKERNTRLGITDKMYADKELARKWYKSIAQFVHSDKIGGDRRPIQELQKIYESITFESVENE